MKYVKIFITSGEPVKMELERFMQAMKSEGEFIVVDEYNGFKKSHIVQWLRDRESERDWNDKNIKKLTEPVATPISADKLKKMRESLMKGKII